MFWAASLLSLRWSRFFKFMLFFLARGVLLSVGWNSRNRTIIESLFFGSLLWGSCRLCRLRERFSTLWCISLCCRFNLHRVLYLSIRPLRWGYFCRLKQNKAMKSRIDKVFYAVFPPWLRLKCSQWNNHCCAFILVKTKIQRKILLPLRLSIACQKFAFSYAAFGERILICVGKSKYRPPMRLKLGGGIPTFKLEKIRLNSKLSVKIV